MTWIAAGTRNEICYNRTRRMGRMLAGITLAAGVGGLLGGCARGVATTTVRPNGSWTRKVTFHGSKPEKDGSAMGTTISEAFVLPTGAGWKVTHEDTKDEAVVVAERALEPGETLRGDITVKGGKKQPMPTAVNEVTVQKTAPGVFKYTETIHWKGPVPKSLTPDADMIVAFKKALPPALATEANARSLAAQSIRDLWHVMFGPGDPLISQLSSLMSSPELVERRVQQRIGATLEQHIEAKFGAQMTAEQRRSMARSIIHSSLFSLTSQTKNAGPMGAQPEPGNDKADKEDTTPSASLFIAVKLPGRITAANGERDDVNGEVFWALYPEAAVLGDVTLTATCDTNAQSASRQDLKFSRE